ncbi:DUF6538 domain-containing protein [Caballeronia novacaledonica]
MRVRYVRERSSTGPLWFRRRVPEDLQTLIGSKWIQCSLGTRDLRQAAKMVSRLVSEQDRQWAELRTPSRSGLKAQAQALLAAHGLSPDTGPHPEEALLSFYDTLDSQAPALQEQDSATDSELARHLPAASLEALRLVQGRSVVTVSDCQAQYTQARPKTAKSAQLAFGYLLAFLKGDRSLAKVRRSDVNGFVTWLREGGHRSDGQGISTTSVGRLINTLGAAFAFCIRENELSIPQNVFSRVEVPGSGKDAEKRLPFTVDNYRSLQKAIDDWERTKGLDQGRCVIGLLAETGARLSEILGLLRSDVHLTGPTPHIVIQEHAHRSLKNAATARKVPLTPTALQYAKAALRSSEGSADAGRRSASTTLFPQWATAEKTNNNSASAALNKWLRTREGLQGTGLTLHSLRHGMKDQLRAAQCPDSIQDAILGHSSGTVGSKYGTTYPLPVFLEWLLRAAQTVHGGH